MIVMKNIFKIRQIRNLVINNELIENLQGCLLSKEECDGKTCTTLTIGKNSTPISNDAFQETIVSNSEHHPTSERNISISLGREIDAFDFKSIHELEVLGRVRLDICCYNDPSRNCNGISSHQPNQLSTPNCISTQGKHLLSFFTSLYLTGQFQ